MSTEVEGAAARTQDRLPRARDTEGRWLPDGERPTAKTESNKRRLNERDYLSSIVAEVGRADVARIARQIVSDAEAKDDTDVKVVNAAREWLGKYLLGNARVSLDDCERRPAIVKRK